MSNGLWKMPRHSDVSDDMMERARKAMDKERHVTTMVHPDMATLFVEGFNATEPLAMERNAA